ncbi:hypothetical protein MTR67_012800 [Solanum verrucosum]|uniref:Reverse transcriptase domain-containing protein n=1 Tax=Solanum verrucosum TaxID=315347 RepID=A0AAF0QBZ2_SOLVR|nr:hypothetical protein MTR67_012800 [Solanum verrucosum]
MKMILREWKISWEILDIVEEARQIVEQNSFKVQHVYRKGNQLADVIANSAYNILGVVLRFGPLKYVGRLQNKCREITVVDNQAITMNNLQVVGAIKKLNNQNYNAWETCIMSYMQGQDLWEVVNGSEVVNGNEVAQPESEDANGPLSWGILAAFFSKKNDARFQLLENELLSSNQRDLTIAQYFHRVKKICREISYLDPTAPIRETRNIVVMAEEEYGGSTEALPPPPPVPLDFSPEKVEPGPVKKIKVLDRVHETYHTKMAGKDFAYDGEKSLFTIGSLPRNGEDVKKVVFRLNGDSSSGPDGLTGRFFQVCWDIVGYDIIRMVQEFFAGNTLPKSITHTNSTLIPKKDNVQTFSDMRPISLSNFVNKVLSRINKIIHDRLENILPNLISSNQSAFVKGRSIIENVLLAQELVTDITKRGKPTNVVIKLDMAKVYDRVSWVFLMKVLRKMGLSDRFVNMVWRLISNNYYSILLNGPSYGFFHSTRGVKQGDPLSPTLFILSAEVLSRALNSLFDDPQFVGYGMPRWSANLNHLAYADDTIIFASSLIILWEISWLSCRIMKNSQVKR